MIKVPHTLLLLATVLLGTWWHEPTSQAQERPAGPKDYSWSYDQGTQALADRFAPPVGYERVAQEDGSFGDWLRRLPLKAAGEPVRLYDGKEKSNQSVHAAVIDMDVGSRDLQQCADAAMRLWAEYLWTQNRGGQICFRTAGGPAAKWSKWRDGYRPSRQNPGQWERVAKANSGYASFRRYLNRVFGMANSASLWRQTKRVAGNLKTQPGQIFIEPAGSQGYGHVVVVLDVAQNSVGKRVFMIGQSYMPAQDFHVLVNPRIKNSVWYESTPDGSIETPEWTFPAGSLREFKKRGC